MTSLCGNGGRRAALRVEELDPRVVPAIGAVGVFEGDYLTVFGDDTANEIYLRRVVVAGVPSIQIDGGYIALDTPGGVRVGSVPVASVARFSVIAGNGNDTVHVDPLLTTPGGLTVNDGNDIAIAGGGTTVLVGGNGNDSLFGGPGTNFLYGQNGVDDLIGGGGTDAAFGGLGGDVFRSSVESRLDFSPVAPLGPDVLVLGDPPTPPLPVAVPPNLALGLVIPPFAPPSVVVALAGSDFLVVVGTPAADTVLNRANPDGTVSLFASPTSTTPIPIFTDTGIITAFKPHAIREVGALLADGADTLALDLVGGLHVLVAGPGADTVTAGRGENFVFGQEGADTLVARGGANNIYAGVGNDVGRAEGKGNRLWGGAGADDLAGSAGAFNEVYGEADNDILTAKVDVGGSNLIFGGSGADAITAIGLDSTSSRVFGEDGADTIFVESGVGAGNAVFGGSGNDYIETAGSGSSKLFGEDGNDFFFTRNGTFDSISGGAGIDEAHIDFFLDIVGVDVEIVN